MTVTGKSSVGQEVPEIELLIRLLKLGSFVNTPMKDAVSDPAGLGANEIKVVMALAGEGELAGHDLAGIMGIAPMNVSRAIAALKEAGWVEDAQDPGNRRRRPVRLTAKGKRRYAAMERQLASLAAELFGPLGTRERAQFAASSDALIASLAEWIKRRHGELRFRI